MSTLTQPAPRVSSWPLPLRFALRELRGGLRGFYVFIACIALGVMAIAGVGSVADSLVAGLGREGRILLGGDVAFSLIQREADDAQRAFLARQGDVSRVATMRTMARAGGEAALVDLKAVDAAYPLYGALETEPAFTPQALFAQTDGAFGATAAPELLDRLGLHIGDRVKIGNADFIIRATLKTEPDKIAGGIAYGPRVLTSEEGLAVSGLLQPGSLVRWNYRVRLPPGASDDDAAATIARAKQQLPDAGWETRTRTNVSPQVERNVERFTQFLTLVGLTSLLVGGVGVANAVKSLLDRKRDVIAAMKATGATGGAVFAIYLTQVLLLAAIGSIIGLVVGGAMPFAVKAAFGAIIPLPMAPALHPFTLAIASLYGLLTALAFALWPLGRAHDVPVSALFRDEIEPVRRWPRMRYVIATAAAALVLVALAIGLAHDQKIAAIFVASAAVVLVVLRGLAALMMIAARRLPHAKNALVRLAIANIHRPGALTPTVVLSLGLGLSLLVTLVEIDGNLRNQFQAALPDRAPSFFFVDIPASDAARFDAFVAEHAPGAHLERVPMLRGRIVSANKTASEDIKPDSDAEWVLQSDRGMTYTGDVPEGSRVVAGEWWGRDYDGPPLVSFEQKLAQGLHLKIGDTITVNVLGRTLTARIANLRTVDWQSLGINFVMVFSPNAFRGAPTTQIASLTYPGGGGTQQEAALLKDIANTFPMVTAVRVKDVLDALGALIANLVLGIRGASLITLVAAVLVLGGALAAGHRHRVYDAVILKTLGATRSKLLGAYTLEYLMLGLVTAVLGVIAGSVAAWLVITKAMTLPFTLLVAPAIITALGALALTVVLGLVGTYAALGHKPAPVLRNL